MWVFLNNAMLSIVQDKEQPDQLLVRARFKHDIEAFFSGEKIPAVVELPVCDYRYRVWVPRELVEAAMLRATRSIDYTNFKDSIPKQDQRRGRAYMGVWATMYEAQENERIMSHGW